MDQDIRNKAYQEIQEKIKNVFKTLEAQTIGLDPVKLLCQFSTTYLTVLEGKSSNTEEYSRHHIYSELLFGFLMNKKPSTQKIKDFVNGSDIENIFNTLEEYFRLFTQLIMFEPDRKNQFMTRMKLSTLNIRGETYSENYIELAIKMYSKHQSWFEQNLGFNINHAVTLFKVINEEFTNRINDKERIEKLANSKVDDLIRKKKIKQEQKKSVLQSHIAYFMFAESDYFYEFDAITLNKLSGLDIDICQSFLNRMSQERGYVNPKVNSTYDAETGPFTYNTLYERPIIKSGIKYYVPILATIPYILFHTFHYDLLSDKQYFDEYTKIRGEWLESYVAEIFRKIFPRKNIFIRPLKNTKTEEEFCDVLILHNRKVWIIQCKSKELQLVSKFGLQEKIFTDDLQKSVIAAATQAVRAKELLQKEEKTTLNFKQNGTLTGKLEIDNSQVTDVFTLVVTLGDFQSLLIKLSSLDKEMNIFQSKDYPWAVSLFDLDIIVRLFKSPGIFTHYLKKRLEVESAQPEILSDELDLLGFYIDHNCCFPQQKEELTMLSIVGLSRKVDEYFETGKGEEAHKMLVEKPPGYISLINEVENLNLELSNDAISLLLSLNLPTREKVLELLENNKKSSVSENKIKTSSLLFDDFGISIMHGDFKKNLENTFKQLSSQALTQKHKYNKKIWLVLGGDIDSESRFDTYNYLEYENSSQPDIELFLKEQGLI